MCVENNVYVRVCRIDTLCKPETVHTRYNNLHFSNNGKFT